MAEPINRDAYAAFARRAGEGPVTMVNLLAFRPDGGREMYGRYLKEVTPLLANVGGRVVYQGDGAELLIGTDDQRWDMVLLVEYPRRQALIDMITSEAYKAILHYREDSLLRSVLLVSEPRGQ